MKNCSFKRVSDCRLSEVVEAWNNGFTGYMVDVTMDVSKFIRRMVMEDIDPNQSIVAISDEKPVAIILNGFRDINGKRVAWNGGTGIAPEFRGTGLSHELMKENEQIYIDQGVQEAYLEAISTNDRAIKLYEKHGYSLDERLTFYKGPENSQDLSIVQDLSLEICREPGEKIQQLSFYDGNLPWQNQLPSLKGGSYYILYDRKRPIGYAATKETFNSKGYVNSIQLFQLGVEPALMQDQLLLVTLLHHIFKLNQDDIKRQIINFPNRSNRLLESFQQIGFEKTIEQVHMKKSL